MVQTATIRTTDPLAGFLAKAVGARHPIPLVATAFEIDAEAGLVTVAMRRDFRNEEPGSIEAAITFPVPIHAVVHALTARIGDRVLTALAQPADAARATYEAAIEAGRTTVLHQELLRGLHMLSVGHVPPGETVSVTATWTMTPTLIGGRARIRIPLTVGEIYGRSPLPDSDDLLTGGPGGWADLVVRSPDGPAALAGGALVEGHARVPLDRPIDLDLAPWSPRSLAGRDAAGRAIAIEIAPSAAPEGPIAAAILVDHSGSMAEACTPLLGGPTKHAAAVAGLAEIAALLGRGDAVDLWEFATAPRLVGTATGASLLSGLAGRLSAPGGGTNIREAVAAASGRGDVLLVTDGKAHALDVQALVRTVGRLTVVLVGEDSLEADVGHLAALTGGEIFIAGGIDLAPAMAAAARSLRRPRSSATGTVARGGFTITTAPVASAGAARPGVAALVAGLRLPHLEREEAAALAAAEGIVCHLTSLVLVDEDGPVQQGLPAYRKVPLPAPASAPVACSAPMGLADFAPPPPRPPRASIAVGFAERARGGLAPTARPQIDWDGAPQRLADGDLSGLAEGGRKAIRAAASLLPVRLLARRMRLTPERLALGLLARCGAAQSRSAARIAKAILGDWPPADLDAAAAAAWG